MVRNQGKVTRFVVMAVLQAARARTLGLPEATARSWGLNRAIFYAAAKRGFRGGTARSAGAGSSGPREHETLPYRLDDDEAHVDPKAKETIFTLGDQDQTAEAFEKSVAIRFGTKKNFRAAWEEALRIVGGFDRAALESRQRFYDEVYRPRRDELSDDWTARYSPTRPTK